MLLKNIYGGLVYFDGRQHDQNCFAFFMKRNPKKNEFSLKGSKFFSLVQIPFKKGLMCMKANGKSQNVSHLTK